MQTEKHTALALLVIRERRVGLALAPQTAWNLRHGVQMARLELPHVDHAHAAREPADEAPGDEHAQQLAQALALSQTWFGVAAALTTTSWTYGPSARHAIDRAPASPASPATPAPFLHMERISAQDEAIGEPPRLLATLVYRAELMAEPQPQPAATTAILWLPPAALRVTALGLRYEDALRLDDVVITPAPGVSVPPDLFLFMPCDYGERLLHRVAAKYGDEALFSARG